MDEVAIESESPQQETREKKGSLHWLLWLCVLVFVYILSVGPVAKFKLLENVHGLYLPLEKLAYIFPPFGSFLGWYMHLWGVI
jgi:hypothetical protein